MDIDKDQYIWYEYIFNFKDREKMLFPIYLDKQTTLAIPLKDCKTSEWTKLDFNQCDICPLDPKQVLNCPIAFNISGLAERFYKIFSTEEVDIVVNSAERSYFKKDSVQQGLRGILGIYMATSGCPHMNILKPMARFHLPFASIDETIYRHIGNYLISQYYEYVEGNQPDLDLNELIKKNERVSQVNHGICKRLEKITDTDANKNAIIILNAIGILLNMEVESKLDSLKHLFTHS